MSRVRTLGLPLCKTLEDDTASAVLRRSAFFGEATPDSRSQVNLLWFKLHIVAELGY